LWGLLATLWKCVRSFVYEDELWTQHFLAQGSNKGLSTLTFVRTLSQFTREAHEKEHLMTNEAHEKVCETLKLLATC